MKRSLQRRTISVLVLALLAVLALTVSPAASLFGGERGTSTGGQRGQDGLATGEGDPENPATPSGPEPTPSGATHYNPCGPDGEQLVDEDGFLVFDDYGDPVCTDGRVIQSEAPVEEPVDEIYYYEEEVVPDDEGYTYEEEAF